MKKINILLAALAAAVCVQAQPVISNQFYPKAGQFQRVLPIDTAGIGPGEAGAEIIWDYAGLTGNPFEPWTIYDYRNPAQLPYGDGPFLAANVGAVIAESESTDYFYTYFRAADDWKWLGTGDGLSAPFVFSDPLTLLKPIPFDGSFRDTARLSYDYEGFILEQYIEQEVWYRAYGTLILPTDTFENVIQLEYNLMQIDTFAIQDDYYSVDTIYTQSWRWMAPDYPGPLLTYTITEGSSTFVVSGQEPEYTTFGPNHEAEYDFDSPPITSVPDPDAPLFPVMQLYPNPAKEAAWLRLASENSHDGATLSVWASTGQRVHNRRIDIVPGDNQYELPVNGLPAGLYSVTVELGGRSQAVRLFVR